MSLIRSDCFILHSWPYSETSLILKVLSRDHGLITLIAKGARNPKGRFFGTLESLSRTELVWQAKETREMQDLRESHLLNYFKDLRTDLHKNAQVQVMAELLLKFWQESGDSSEYYTKFMQFLEDATRYQGESSFMLSGFISQLMENLGFGMQFNTCVRCGYSFEKVPLVLAPEQGGAICHNCSTGVLGQSPEFIHTLRKITRGSLKPDAHMQKIPPQDCEEFLLQFMMGHLQMYPVLKSRDSLRQIRSLLF